LIDVSLSEGKALGSEEAYFIMSRENRLTEDLLRMMRNLILISEGLY
jgi:hypothetical protein